MKNVLKLGLAVGILAITFGCKKDNTLLGDDDPSLYVEGWTRVIGVKLNSTDTSTTSFMHARTQTVGLLLVEDAMLIAELMSFTPLPNNKGQYIVKMTNKQPCQVILRWGWEGLTLDQGTPESDVLKGNESVIFTFTGDAKPGRIKVKADKSSAECNNSSTLILEITASILPIEFTSAKTYRKGKDMYVTFSTEEPHNVDWFYVMWSPDGKKENEKIVAHVESDHSTKNYKLSYPAIKKEDAK